MPPQQTNPASESDAAVRGLDLTIALVKATVDTLAAARPNASIAALDDALSEKNAVGLTAVSTRNVLSLRKRYWRSVSDRVPFKIRLACEASVQKADPQSDPSVPRRFCDTDRLLGCLDVCS